MALVDELESRRLAERVVDRRTKAVAATPEGRWLVHEATAAVRSAEAELHSQLSASDRAQLMAYLKMLAFAA